MSNSSAWRVATAVVATCALTGCRDAWVDPARVAAPELRPPAATMGSSQVASMYAPIFVATAATGYDLNDVGDVVGWSYPDPGCGPFCLPVPQIAVWRGGAQVLLPLVPGYSVSYQFPIAINTQGLVGGYVGIPGSTTHVAAWTPSGGGYTATDLGALPGMTSADVAGMDDQGRMVGWSSTGGAIPTAAAPFMWSQATGMVNLATQGYPNEQPGAISPGGKVLTSGHWYQLGNPASALPLPAPPRGFVGGGGYGSAINDAGDQAHFLSTTSSQSLAYPFRLSNGGTWQQISLIGTGHLTRYRMGSINAAQDISLTVTSTGMIAAGPTGSALPLSSFVSPAYPGVTVVDGGPMNSAGQILAQVMIGRSQRLSTLTPVVPCVVNCLVSASVAMTGQFVQDPAFPGSCFQGGIMYNLTNATVTVTSETGSPLANVQVRGRFLDDYWTNRQVTGTTNASGVATWSYKGPCGVGAIAFLVDDLVAGTRTFDRTRGVATNWVIPSTTPPPNQPPVAVGSVSCTNLVCTFDGTRSSDDVGVTAYEWRLPGGTLVSTKALWTRTFTAGGNLTIVLTVFDGGGLSNSQTLVFDPAGGSPPGNQPPVAAPVANCVAGRTCTFDGTASSDPDGVITAYKWATTGGSTLSTQATFTRTFPAAGPRSIVLSVTDNGGLTTSKTLNFTVLP